MCVVKRKAIQRAKWERFPQITPGATKHTIVSFTKPLNKSHTPRTPTAPSLPQERGDSFPGASVVWGKVGKTQGQIGKAMVRNIIRFNCAGLNNCVINCAVKQVCIRRICHPSTPHSIGASRTEAAVSVSRWGISLSFSPEFKMSLS